MERKPIKYCVPQGSADYIHWKCLIPVAKSLAYKNGGEYYEGEMPGEPCVVIGHHLLTEPPPKQSIIVNTEYHLNKTIEGYELWDILEENNEQYGKLVRLVNYPIDIPNIEPIESDVLFSGAMNPRRARIISVLIDKGLHVEWVEEKYEKDLIPYLLGAKIVLDVHFYEKGRFNILRLLTALQYGKAVVSESQGGYYGDKLSGGFISCDYDKIIDNVLYLLNNEANRLELELKAKSIIQLLV